MKLGSAAVSLRRGVKASPLSALLDEMRRKNAGCRDTKLLPVNFGGCSLIDAFTVFRRRWDRFSSAFSTSLPLSSKLTRSRKSRRILEFDSVQRRAPDTGAPGTRDVK